MTTWSDEMPPVRRPELKFFIASFNRASDGALSKLLRIFGTDEPESADYIILPGDRKETFEFALEWYGIKPLIHLWAGEVSQGTHDEIYRWAITNMSMMQLCTTPQAEKRVIEFFNVVGREANVHVVGNVMLDNIPILGYDVVLYNPPTLLSKDRIQREIEMIYEILRAGGMETYFWHPPNGDNGSELIEPHVNARNLSRNHFLNLVRHCNRFISNSSCIDYEIRHIIEDDRIVRIGGRNESRSSIEEDMTIPNATENILKVLNGLT